MWVMKCALGNAKRWLKILQIVEVNTFSTKVGNQPAIVACGVTARFRAEEHQLNYSAKNWYDTNPPPATASVYIVKSTNCDG